MVFNVKYSWTDYYSALELNSQQSKARWIVPTIGILLLLMEVSSIYTYWHISPFDVINLFFGLFFLFYEQILLRLIAYWLLKRDKYLNKIINYHVNEREIEIKTEGESERVLWAAFTKALYSDNLLLLCRGLRRFNVITRKSLPSEKEWNHLIQMVKNHNLIP